MSRERHLIRPGRSLPRTGGATPGPPACLSELPEQARQPPVFLDGAETSVQSHEGADPSGYGGSTESVPWNGSLSSRTVRPATVAGAAGFR